MIVLTYDHGGYEMFKKIKKYLEKNNLEYVECANKELNLLDGFPEFGKKANALVLKGNIGIYGCRSGIGMSMVSNRQKGVRGALCYNEIVAEMARKHNDANVCIIPCDYITFDVVEKILDTFLNTGFLGGKYQERINELDN